MALCLTQARPIRALITHAGDRQSENSSRLAPHSTRMNLSDLSGILIHSHLQIAGITIFFYDYLLTFPAEVSYIWPQPISLNTTLFYLIRYISFVGNIATLIIFFSGINDSEEGVYSCTSVSFARQALLVVSQVIVAVILATRTIALYNSSRAIILGVLGFGFGLAGVTCWTLVGLRPSNGFIRGIPGCNYNLSENAAVHLATAWETSALFDAFIFVLTLMRTLKIRNMHHMASGGLVDILLRDGAFYFAVMALTNVANILTFYFAQPTFKGIFTTPVSCISASLCSRLVLNLYETATSGDANSGSPEPTAAAVLTTRIELDIPLYDDHIDFRP